MLRFAGLNAGQFGDLVMNTVAARAIKQKWPDSHLTMGIGKPYADIAPLFKHHPDIDDIHIWESYDGLTANDQKYIQEQEFDKIFNPMPKHHTSDWYNTVQNQTEEVCLMHGLKPPEDLSCHLNKWFLPVLHAATAKFVSISPWTAHAPKDMGIERWVEIVRYIKSKGYDVCQLSAPNQPEIQGTFRNVNKTYFGSVQTLLGSEFLLTLDGGLSWVASGYKHPVLGLYGLRYPGQISSKVYQPINPNATYLEADHPNSIPMEEIFENIDRML